MTASTIESKNRIISSSLNIFLLDNIIKKKGTTRCTTCLRNKQIAIREQVAVKQICPMSTCAFLDEVAAALEKKKKLVIVEKKEVPINKKPITIVPKPPKIVIVKKKDV